jgi:alpha-galactosidase
MLCSGGGGRVDYGALKFFHSFWPSDNTDPRSRVFIQWGFSHFFPAESMAAHVTRMGNRPVKFCVDVAMSGALGLDLDVRKLSPADRRTLADSITLYKKSVRDLVGQGDLHRLESPYDHPRAALDYVAPDQRRALVFVYQLKQAAADPVKPGGLNPGLRYHAHELNLGAGTTSRLAAEGRTATGAEWMSGGFVPACEKPFESCVLELAAEE